MAIGRPALCPTPAEAASAAPCPWRPFGRCLAQPRIIIYCQPDVWLRRTEDLPIRTQFASPAACDRASLFPLGVLEQNHTAGLESISEGRHKSVSAALRRPGGPLQMTKARLRGIAASGGLYHRTARSRVEEFRKRRPRQGCTGNIPFAASRPLPVGARAPSSVGLASWLCGPPGVWTSQSRIPVSAHLIGAPHRYTRPGTRPEHCIPRSPNRRPDYGVADYTDLYMLPDPSRTVSWRAARRPLRWLARRRARRGTGFLNFVVPFPTPAYPLGSRDAPRGPPSLVTIESSVLT
jgi:hypothetical protein